MGHLHDLSQRFSPSMSYPPALPAPTFDRIMRVPEHKSHVSHYSFSSHVGTHMDAPFHYFPEKPHLDDVALERFRGPGFVVPLRKERLSQVMPEDLEPYRDQIAAAPFTLLSTGWAAYFGDDEYLNHPFLSEAAALELVELGSRCVVLDVLTPDAAIPVRPPGHGGPVHQILLGNDVLIVENAASMAAIEGTSVDVLAFPMLIDESDGAPVRLIAEVTNGSRR